MAEWQAAGKDMHKKNTLVMMGKIYIHMCKLNK